MPKDRSTADFRKAAQHRKLQNGKALPSKKISSVLRHIRSLDIICGARMMWNLKETTSLTPKEVKIQFPVSLSKNILKHLT